MGVGTGVGASIGIAPEVTYGTYVAPSTRWLEIASANLKKKKNTKQGGGLAAGRLVQSSTRRVVTTLGGGGDISMEVQNKSMGLLLQALMGGTPTFVAQTSPTAILHTYALGDPVGKFLTIQAGVPQTDGVVKPYSFLGSKVLGAEFSCDIDGLLMAKFDIDSRDVTEAQTLAAPSYPTAARPFHGVQMSVKVHATYGSEVSVSGVTGVTCKIERGSEDGRYYAGAAGLKAEPLINDNAKISGVIKADFTDKTIWADRFAADTQFALCLEWVGPVIATTFFETFRIKLPANFLDGDGPAADGPGIVNGSFPFVTQYDGTNAPATIEYMTTDVGL